MDADADDAALFRHVDSDRSYRVPIVHGVADEVGEQLQLRASRAAYHRLAGAASGARARRSSAPSALYELGLYANANNRSRRVLTMGTSVALAQLLALDGAPGLGKVQLSVTSFSPAPGGIDAYVTQPSDLDASPTRGFAEPIEVTRIGPDAGSVAATD